MHHLRNMSGGITSLDIPFPAIQKSRVAFPTDVFWRTSWQRHIQTTNFCMILTASDNFCRSIPVDNSCHLALYLLIVKQRLPIVGTHREFLNVSRDMLLRPAGSRADWIVVGERNIARISGKAGRGRKRIHTSLQVMRNHYSELSQTITQGG